MTRKIQVRRGLAANLVALDEGEIGFTTDAKKLYVGTAAGNESIVKAEDLTPMQNSIDLLLDTRSEFNDAKVNINKVPAIEDDIVSLAGNAIIELGGNDTDGFYIKYENGLVEFFGRIRLNGTFVTGAKRYYNKYLGVLCVTHPIVTLTASIYDGKGEFSDYRALAGLNGTNLDGFYGHVHVEYSAATINYIGIHYHAKAMWKLPN